jgi:hypothetical protein
VTVTTDDDRVLLSHETGAAPGSIRMPDRSTMVQAVESSGTLSLAIPVYLDGFSRQSFLTALHTLLGAIDAGPAVPVAAAESTTHGSPVEEPEPTREMPAAWTPTHAVPAGGTRAWAAPDPSQEPIATLEARVRLSIAETRGEWAKVIGSNGWTGWVDARLLEPLTADAFVSRPASPTRPVRTLPAVGAVAIVLSAFLPWVRGALGSANSFDVSARFLFDYGGTGSPELAWVILGLAALALVVAFVKGVGPLGILVGLAAIAAGGLFLLQLYRGITDGGGALSDVLDVASISPLLTIAGGVLVLVGARRR